MQTIAQLVKELERLQKQFNRVRNTKARSYLVNRMRDVEEQIDEESKKAWELVEDFQRSRGMER